MIQLKRTWAIDRQHDLGQLRFTELIIEFRVQLLELGRFFFRCSGRPMQLIINPKFAGLGRFRHGGIRCLCAFNERLQERFSMLG